MKIWLAIFSIYLLLSGLSPAVARSPVRDFAECIARGHEGQMQRWVDFDGPGLIYKELPALAAKRHCQPRDAFDYWDFRGVLAELLVRPQLTSLPDFSSSPPLTDIEMALAWGNNDGRHSMLLDVFSECVVREAREDVRNLLLSEAGSKAERTVVASIKESNGNCQKLAGNLSMKESDATLRGRLAIALNQMLQLYTAGRVGAD